MGQTQKYEVTFVYYSPDIVNMYPSSFSIADWKINIQVLLYNISVHIKKEKETPWDMNKRKIKLN
jgi:hypothetical protein